MFVASERLHGRIVQHLDRAFEGGFEIETGPTLSQIPGFRNGPVSEHRSGVTDGDNIVFPVSNEFPNFRDCPLWRQVRSGNKLPFAVLAGGKDLDVGSAYINCKNIHNGVDGDVSFDGH